MKTLLLVDGSSYLYRAFHAMPDLRSPTGEPTGAIQGVLNMLRKLRADYPSDYSACVFDAKGKTFRDDMYPQYKAQRPSMPPELAAQIEPLHKAIAAFGWNILMIDGVEADDVIGTLALQAKHGGGRCIISTGDKDLTQLVNGQVTLINTMSNETLDEAGVLAKFGVPPERMVDYLTLIGDTVDNVPGVSKCGPKTAVKWLSQYGTLDNLIAHASEVGGVVGENLRNTLEWLPTGRQLITVKCDVPLPLRYDELVAPPQDSETLRTLLQGFGFKSLLRDVLPAAASPSSSQPEAGDSPQQGSMFDASSGAVVAPATRYECLLSEAQLDAWLAKIMQAELVCVDTETTGLDSMTAQLVGISFAIEAHHAAYLPLAHHYPGAPEQITREHALKKLKPWLESATHKKLGQNLKYDQHIFANHGIKLAGIAEDTLLQSYVLESHKPHNMDNLALRHLGVTTISYEEVAGKGAKQIGFDQVAIDTATRYAAEDADITLQLHQTLLPQLKAQGQLESVYRDIEMPARQVLFVMERNGVLLDSKLLNIQSRELGEKLLDLETRAYELAGQPFNMNSPKQVQEILFEKLGLPVKKKTPSGTPSTDEEVLQELALDYPLPKLMLEYRGLSKLKSTYTDKLPQMVNAQTGRVHTSYSQAVAVTGRLASSDPNLQNIPVRTAEGRRIREAFIADPGSHIVSADYSQIELRIMAHLSGDAGLLHAFAHGHDVHRATAAEIFAVEPDAVSSEQRRYAKVINFGLIYGMSAFGLASQLGIERSAAQAYIERYFARYPGVANYMQTTRDKAKQQGYVETVFGRRLWLPEINGGNGMRRQAAERAAINAPMQGTAADLIKLAMVAVQNWLEKEKLQTRLIMQVHDELVLEVPDSELALVKDKLPGLMCNVAQLKVPLEVGLGVGVNWEAAH
ncbi:MAG: DNA polymerase I [Gallionellales bacterium 35-53-114]|jgi:DNA polymerase-1|nr:MAG: DNA polymerase I [Gallionellales bacterium 35-53-114]OYZ64431.1 MAG: DNA polymerase I [Gallionellales bacterium 24-53-125]OZB10262.1 MAG: DNA polymerase I [Gallionellales bacterium 39-52-133]HQS56856.1 DNA polymerase I [Gallionellaceae bacterium]HQS75360.1 DNA polymerase I [Gallionellaceae bacterium]